MSSSAPVGSARRSKPLLLHPAAKPLLFVACLLPFAWLFYGALANTLGVARNVVCGSYEYLSKGGKLDSAGRKGRRVRAKSSRSKATSAAAKKTKSKLAAARKKAAARSSAKKR